MVKILKPRTTNVVRGFKVALTDQISNTALASLRALSNLYQLVKMINKGQ